MKGASADDDHRSVSQAARSAATADSVAASSISVSFQSFPRSRKRDLSRRTVLLSRAALAYDKARQQRFVPRRLNLLSLDAACRLCAVFGYSLTERAAARDQMRGTNEFARLLSRVSGGRGRFTEPVYVGALSWRWGWLHSLAKEKRKAGPSDIRRYREGKSRRDWPSTAFRSPGRAPSSLTKANSTVGWASGHR